MAFEKKIRLVAPTMTVTRKDERKSFFVFTERVATAKSPSGERIEVVRVISNPNNLLLWGEEFEGDIDLSATLQAAFANVTRENGGVIAQAEAKQPEPSVSVVRQKLAEYFPGSNPEYLNRAAAAVIEALTTRPADLDISESREEY